MRVANTSGGGGKLVNNKKKPAFDSTQLRKQN